MSARQAFTHELNAAALAGIAIAAALALLAAVMLRHTAAVMLRHTQVSAEVAVPVKDGSSSAATSAMTDEQAYMTPSRAGSARPMLLTR